MPDPAPNAELLRSLGRLARGLSALFWGLPVAFVVCVQTAKTELAPVVRHRAAAGGTGLLLYGLWQMGTFPETGAPLAQRARPRQAARADQFGLCPFLYWWNQVPGQPFFSVSVAVLALSALLFLFNLNLVLAAPRRHAARRNAPPRNPAITPR